MLYHGENNNTDQFFLSATHFSLVSIFTPLLMFSSPSNRIISHPVDVKEIINY
jgi:hypothetical protein